jgi:hypothetical protein
MWGLKGTQGIAYNLAKPVLRRASTVEYHACLEKYEINSKGLKGSALINWI